MSRFGVFTLAIVATVVAAAALTAAIPLTTGLFEAVRDADAGPIFGFAAGGFALAALLVAAFGPTERIGFAVQVFSQVALATVAVLAIVIFTGSLALGGLAAVALPLIVWLLDRRDERRRVQRTANPIDPPHPYSLFVGKPSGYTVTTADPIFGEDRSPHTTFHHPA